MLVSRRHLRSLNSWIHNVDTLVTGRDRCTLQMHSADATRHGLAVGDTVALSSPAGEIHVPLEIADDIRPGVVRSDEHTSELQSLMRISYAPFCSNNKLDTTNTHLRLPVLTTHHKHISNPA